MKNAHIVARLASLMAAITAGGAFAVDYSVNAVDYVDPASGTPAVWTQLWGNNNLGQVVGAASMTDPTGASDLFTFIYDPVSGFVPPPLPPSGVAADVGAFSINDAHDVSGNYFDSTAGPTPPEVAYIQRDGVYSFFSHPGWPDTEGGRTISNPTTAHPRGLVVGFAYDPATAFAAVGSSVGFVYDPISGAFYDLPTPPSTITIAQRLNIAGP